MALQPPAPPQKGFHVSVNINAQALKVLLADLAMLKDPKLALMVGGLAANLIAPLFGLHIGPVATAITSSLVAVGMVVSFIEKQRAVKKARKPLQANL